MRRTIEWPDGKKICCTFTVALEAFNKGGHFKKSSNLEVNLASISHANYGGNVGIWRIMEICERNSVRATIDVNGLACERWPDAVKELHDQGHEIAGHGTTNDIKITDLSPDEQREEIRACSRIIEDVTGAPPVPERNHDGPASIIRCGDEGDWSRGSSAMRSLAEQSSREFPPAVPTTRRSDGEVPGRKDRAKIRRCPCLDP